jgi:hypothetical protein
MGFHRPHKPKPFQRKVINVSTEVQDTRKEWRDVHPSEIEVGDLILGKGLVVGGALEEFHQEGRPRLKYRFDMKNGTSLYYEAGIESIRAFVRVRG